MHSDVASALMVPFYQDFPDVFPLPEDDVRAIRVLYGPPDHAATLPPPPPPPPTTTTTTTTRRPPPPPRPRPTTTRRPPPPPRTWPTRPPHPRPQPTTLPPPRPPRPPHTRPPPRTTSTTPPPPRRGACPLPRPPPGRDAAESPCSPLPFDAATQYRGELFFFRGAHYWRLGRGAATHPYEYPGTIVRRFPPLRRVDAAYVSAARRLVLFQGAEFFELGGDLRVARRGGLAELGVDAPRLDAAMVWGHNGRVYLFSGHRYWRLGPDGTAERDYPRHTAVWRGVPANLSAALTQGTHTYFLAGAVFWEFDSFAMRVTQQPLLAAPHWLACPAAVSPRKLVQCSGGRRARLHALLLLLMMMMPMLHPRAAP
ncbi:matrix metalloproteinase-15-like isoform X2 [Eriocheir sinensis]|nr:matrix metalloproteinase-15-like isoform X2 [Eriocheir sinensis]